MIGADLESLRLPHNEANFAGHFMFQQLNGTGASLFPLIPVLIKTVQLCLPTKGGKITN